ncbi:MAG: glycosyltransferase family A protein, partial [Cyanobacteriota bacterium]|nr:glycosyltransferase family A protein [Cyanobacteriota bacterium]
DDASEDETWTWLSSLKKQNIRVFRQPENSERSAARNRGLKEARGEFIMFLDDDDRLRPETLEKLVKPLEQKKKLVAAVGARWRFQEDVDDGVKIKHPNVAVERMIWPDILTGWVAVSGQNLYRTELLRNIGGYNTELNRAEDRELWLRVARRGAVILVPTVAVEVRTHSGQQHSPQEEVMARHERIYQDFINSLPPREQQRGQRIRESVRWSQKSESEYKKARYKNALVYALKACKAAPELMVSPLTGSGFTKAIAKSFLGPLRRK